MFSKFMRSVNLRAVSTLLRPKICVSRPMIRTFGDLIPPSQYDTPFPKKLQFLYVIRVYWETIPLFVVTGTSMTIMCIAIAWAIRNKVDVVYSTHSRDNISRTMDLRNPTVHKMVLINQRYDAWPEMQDALDKMTMAEKRALMRLQSCSHA